LSRTLRLFYVADLEFWRPGKGWIQWRRRIAGGREESPVRAGEGEKPYRENGAVEMRRRER
jgi:hypothetical protein